jgi:hypothetical protein
LPISAKQVPVTNPTYPVPNSVMFNDGHPSSHDRWQA